MKPLSNPVHLHHPQHSIAHIMMKAPMDDATYVPIETDKKIRKRVPSFCTTTSSDICFRKIQPKKMEANKDSAIQCLHLAKESIVEATSSSNPDACYDKAIRLINKAKKLYEDIKPSEHGFDRHLKSVDDLVGYVLTKKHHKPNSSNTTTSSNTSSSSSRTSSSSSMSSSSEDSSSSTSSSEPSTPTYTKEQREEVLKILAIKNDHYKVLGVEKKATKEEIKKSYRKLALKFHPDRNTVPEATDAFKIIGAAYMCLSDDEKRQLYDTYGTEDKQRIGMDQQDMMFGRRGFRGGMNGNYYYYGGGMNDDEMFFDLFSQMFGGGMNAQMAHPRRRARQQQHHHHQEHQPEQSFTFGCIQFSFILFILLLSVVPSFLGSFFPQQPSTAEAEIYGNGYYHFMRVNGYSEKRTIDYTPHFSSSKFSIDLYFPPKILQMYGEQLLAYRKRMIADYKQFLSNRCTEQRYFDQPANAQATGRRTWYSKREKDGKGNFVDYCSRLREVFG